jgi:hypothetical protein
MTDKTNTDREPNWQPEQLETDDRDHAKDPDREEIKGGLHGGGGPTWNKGSMEFDDQKKIPNSEMEESEEGPWGSAEQAQRAKRGDQPDR